MIRATLSSETSGKLVEVHGQSDGALSAFCDALEKAFKFELEIINYDQHAIGSGTDSNAVGYVQVKINGERFCGIAKKKDTISANLQAILACVNQAENVRVREAS